MPRPKSLSEQVFGTRDFFRTFSNREILTAITMVLLLFAWIWLFHYLDYDHDLADYKDWINLAMVIVVVLLNHFFYRIEHHRPNNFIGRNFIDYLFCFTAYVIFESFNLIFYSKFQSELSPVGVMIGGMLVFIISISIFECCVAVLKRVMFTIGWHII